MLYYENRSVAIDDNDGTGITNWGVGQTVPLGLTQCKKKIATVSSNNTAESVYITLQLGDDSKVDVDVDFEDPVTYEIYAKVTFENGDRIYVGNNGKYCGYLDYVKPNEETPGHFGGTISPESEDDYLHFYFMGNKDPLIVTDVYSGNNKVGYTV